jgi:inorganic pyrophosphatase
VKLDRLPTWAKRNLVHVVVEAQRGSRLKLKYDPELRAIIWGHPLPVGFESPYDWGFVPSTLGQDGDPLDALVLSSRSRSEVTAADGSGTTGWSSSPRRGAGRTSCGTPKGFPRR